jgi:Ca-activated chloride channel family protein
MGIGEDWNDRLLDEIASRSGGTSAYIASPGQVRTLLRSEVQSLESVFATGLTLSVRTAEGVQVENAFQVSQPLERLDLSSGLARLGALERGVPMKVLLEIAVEARPRGEHRLLQLELNANIPSFQPGHETLKRDIWCRFTDEKPTPRDRSVPHAILSSLSKVTLYRMQEQAWSALEEGHVEQATQQLEMVATRLLNLGEKGLAQAAMLEVKHLADRGRPTERGRRRIKYGTRSLSPGSKRYD